MPKLPKSVYVWWNEYDDGQFELMASENYADAVDGDHRKRVIRRFELQETEQVTLEVNRHVVVNGGGEK